MYDHPHPWFLSRKRVWGDPLKKGVRAGSARSYAFFFEYFHPWYKIRMDE
jgi:hypothetical protein